MNLARRGSQVMRRLYPTGGMVRSEDKEYRQRNHRPSYQHDNAVQEHCSSMTQICGFEYEVLRRWRAEIRHHFSVAVQVGCRIVDVPAVADRERSSQ